MIVTLSLNSSSVSAGVLDYTVDWIAADPASYDHAVGGGAYDDRTLRVDVANALVGNDFTCGDIVSYFALFMIDSPATAEALEFVVSFQANSRVAPGAGFVDIVNVAVNYGEVTDLISGENSIDDAIVDDGGSVATLVEERFEPATGATGGSLYDNPNTEAELIGRIRLDDLEASDSAVVVRVDVRLDCLDATSPAGLLAAELRGATLVEPIVDLLPIGIQSVILSSVDKIVFPPDMADLQASQQAPPIVAPGAPLTYTLTFTNAGPDVALQPQITNTLAPSVAFHSLVVPVGWSCVPPAIGTSGAIGCNHETFLPGAAISMTVGVTTMPTMPLGTVLTNTVAITSAIFDPRLPNYTSVATVASAPVLVATKRGALYTDADNSGFLSPGDTVAYTITVANIGNQAATGLYVFDAIDQISTIVSGTVNATIPLTVEYTTSTNLLRVDLHPLPAGVEPVTLTFQTLISPSLVLTTETTSLVNQAMLFSENAVSTQTDDPSVPGLADPTVLTVTRLGAYYPCMTIPDSECAALQALFVQTNGAFWHQNSGWFTTTDPCSWYGLACAVDESAVTHIIAIDLADNGLQGIIPSQLAQLALLERLTLSHNALAATVPPELGSLTKLTYLNLSENILVGEIPSSLGDLTSLRALYLYGNNFAGDFPTTLQNLTALEAFFFQSTQLCLPQDPIMQAWLAAVTTVAGTAITDCRRIDESDKPLVLVYAGLDNNLASEWGTLVNKLELGANPAAFTVRLLIDSYGDNNSYQFLLEHDEDPTCPSIVTGYLECNRYRRGVTLKEQIEDTAQRDLLAMFIVNALHEHPNASQVILALVGHGAGWGANGLPAQPRGWTEQNGTVMDIAGGMLWDDTSGDGTLTSRSLSTRALGEALRQAKNLTGKGIDLLYLDACSMAMVEVAYEVRDSVDYLLASQNTKWATFPYDELLPHVAEGLDAQTLGERWLATEVALLNRVAEIDYTFSLLALSGMTDIISATNRLVTAMQPLLPEQLLTVNQAIIDTSFFDSNYDGIIDQQDTYLDLYDLAGQLAQTFVDQPAILSSAQELQAAIRATVVREQHRTTGDTVRTAAQWGTIGGLTIYWPISSDEEKRLTLYNSINLRWAADSTWDEWLTHYWQSTEDHRLTELEACDQTADCPALTGWGHVDIPSAQQLFIPMIQR